MNAPICDHDVHSFYKQLVNHAVIRCKTEASAISYTYSCDSALVLYSLALKSSDQNMQKAQTGCNTKLKDRLL